MKGNNTTNIKQSNNQTSTEAKQQANKSKQHTNNHIKEHQVIQSDKPERTNNHTNATTRKQGNTQIKETYISKRNKQTMRPLRG